MEVLGEQHSRRSESLAGLRPTFERILADVHERLTFRARTHIRDEVGYILFFVFVIIFHCSGWRYMLLLGFCPSRCFLSTLLLKGKKVTIECRVVLILLIIHILGSNVVFHIYFFQERNWIIHILGSNVKMHELVIPMFYIMLDYFCVCMCILWQLWCYKSLLGISTTLLFSVS